MENLNKYIEHTLLKQDAAKEDFEKLFAEAREHNFLGVCVNPAYVKLAKEALAGTDVKVVTVIGFPLGYNTTSVKIFETKQAISDGADEIDMVINLGDVKNGYFDKVTNEIKSIREACGNKILKVIIETCYLTQEEKIRLCKCVTDGGADFIKTSTGFGTAGAALDDIILFRNNIGNGVKMKAAGGVKNRNDLEAFLNAGCERIGTSSAIKILSD